MTIARIEVTGEDVTFFFVGDPHPYTVSEFAPDSATRTVLEDAEGAILWANDVITLAPRGIPGKPSLRPTRTPRSAQNGPGVPQ